MEACVGCGKEQDFDPHQPTLVDLILLLATINCLPESNWRYDEGVDQDFSLTSGSTLVI